MLLLKKLSHLWSSLTNSGAGAKLAHENDRLGAQKNGEFCLSVDDFLIVAPVAFAGQSFYLLTCRSLRRCVAPRIIFYTRFHFYHLLSIEFSKFSPCLSP